MSNVENGIGADQTPTNSGIIPNPRLASMLAEHGLEKSDADKLQEALSGSFAIYDEWEAKNAKIVVDSADQVEEMALASEGAKKVAKARTTFTNAWKKVKDPYLKSCQALDAVNRIALPIFKSLEDSLEAKALTGARLAQAQRELIVANRKAELIAVGHNGEIPGLGEMTDETFSMILGGAKEKVRLQREQAEREAAEKAAAELEAQKEAERIANAEKTLNARILRLVEVGAKRGNDPVPYLSLGELTISIESLGAIQDESFDLLVEDFQSEKDRIEALAKAEQDRKDRFGLRVRTLISLGAIEIQDGDNGRLELGDSKVLLVDLATLNESDQRWDFTLVSFQDEAQRIADERAEQVRIKERLAERVKALLSIGAKEYRDNDIVEYRLGGVTITEHNTYDATPESWLDVISAFERESDHLAKIEEDKLRAQQERLQTANDRLAQLREVGCNAAFTDVADLSDVTFNALLKVQTNDFNAAKERQRITNLGMMRKALLDAQGEPRSAEFLGGLTDDEFQSMLDNAVRLKANADQQRANEAAQAAIETQRKADEAAKLKAEEQTRKKAESATDKEKLEDMVKQIQAIVMPSCTSIQGDAIARGAIDRLNKIVGHMHEAMNNM